MGVGDLGWRHLALVFAASIIAGIAIVVIDGLVIAPAEQALFSAVSSTAPTIAAA